MSEIVNLITHIVDWIGSFCIVGVIGTGWLLMSENISIDDIKNFLNKRSNDR